MSIERIPRYRAIALTAVVLISGVAGALDNQQDTAAQSNAATSASQPAAATSPRPAPANAPTAAAGTDSESYVIGADDVISVSVWKEPDLSGSHTVRSDGKISMALLNDVQAAGVTPTQLAEKIQAALKSFINDPRVTVSVTAMNSKKVFVLGEVAHAGAMSLMPGMTVLQALSAAGGLSEYANTKKIYILRTENSKQTKIPFDYKKAINGGGGDQNLLLRSGDTIVVP